MQRVCPLCDKANECGLDVIGAKACWCENVTLPAKTTELDDKLPLLKSTSSSGNKMTMSELEATQSCVCLSCLNKLNDLMVVSHDATID